MGEVKRGRKADSLPVIGIRAPARAPEGPPVELAPWLGLGNIIRVGRYFAVIVATPEYEAGGRGSHFGALTPAIAIRRVNKNGNFCKTREWVPLRDAKRAAMSWRTRLRAAIAYREALARASGPWQVAAHEVGGDQEGAWGVASGYVTEGAATRAAQAMQRAPENSVDPLCYFARLAV